MTTRPDSWETLARALGARMANHAYCPDHAPAERDPAGCPFCDDVVVYERFVKRAGAPSDPMSGAPLIRIEDVPRR